MIFTEKQLITPDLCVNDELSIWGVARLFQDAAWHHTDLFHIGFDDMIKNNQLWVLAKMFYRVNKMPKVGETILIRTWSRGIDGLQCKRDFEMSDGNGNVFVVANSSWVVIDATTRRLVRVDTLLLDFEHHSDQVTEFDRLPRIKLSKDIELDYVKLVDVNESMIDKNNHVNNSEYIKLIYEDVKGSSNSEGKESYSFLIEYLTETQFGDSIKVYKKSATGASSVIYQLCNNSGVSVNAEFYLN